MVSPWALAQDAPPKAGELQPPAVKPTQVQPPLGEIPPSSTIPLKISGKSLEELEQMLKASRVELGQRLADQDALSKDAQDSDPLRDGEKRFLELEAIIKKRRDQRQQELLQLPKTPLGPRTPTNPESVQPVPVPQDIPGQSGSTMPRGDLELAESLLLADVIASTFRSFPEIEIARLEANVARGEITQANGAYDLHLDYFSLNQPVGYYENSRSGVSLSRQLWWGGYAIAGYRIVRGVFEPWYKERETNKGGEFRVGWVQPLLQGRAIDPYRVALFQSNLNQETILQHV